MSLDPVRERRLLFLLPFPPHLDGMHGGSRATAELLAEIAPRHRVALLCLRARDEAGVDPRLAALCESVEEVPRPGAADSPLERIRHAANALPQLIRGQPVWPAARWVSAYAVRARSLALEWEPDIVQVEFSLMGQYLDSLAGCRAPRVLVVHDPGVEKAREGAERSRGLGRILRRSDARRWAAFERRVLRGTDAAVVFTRRDGDAVQRLGARRVVRIPLGTRIPRQSLNPRGEEPPSLLFVGNFVHPPNVDAAAELVAHVFPPLRERFPSLELYIVGADPPAFLRRASGGGVHVTGRVPEVEPYLDRASVVVAPLRIGGGMRVKVLEALAAGKAVVASPLATEGLNLVNGEHALVAGSTQEFQSAIAGLLADPERRARLGAAARARAVANLGWERSVTAYEELYEGLLAESVTPVAVET